MIGVPKLFRETIWETRNLGFVSWFVEVMGVGWYSRVYGVVARGNVCSAIV